MQKPEADGGDRARFGYPVEEQKERKRVGSIEGETDQSQVKKTGLTS